ncbi:hypothetical protein [Aeromonas sobria]|uniref:hypothetical protein n=1 Tax=Aeromonas sobria TaxID=646 RepID=UPI001C12BE26|nr:hypothetical protein [Aeromonas sobria]
MRIKCLDCGHSEEVTGDLFVKIIGGATAGFGFWAWTSFLFAGTGFAMVICIAIIGGGAAMLAYKDEILDWLVNKGYECDGCGSQKWAAVSAEVEKEINAQKAKISKLEKEGKGLTENFTIRENEAVAYVKNQNSSFSLEDVEELLGEIEEKDSRIEALLRDKDEWEKLKESLLSAQERVIGNLEKRFSACYSSLCFSNRALKRIVRLTESDRVKFEQQLGFLQHNPKKASFRDDIIGTDIKELGFGNDGRIYVRKEGTQFKVVSVGNKGSQNADLKHLKSAYRDN